MNQILSTDNKKKSGGPLGIKTVVIIFAVCLIIFGGFLIGKSAFAIMNKNQEESMSEPAVQIRQEENKLNVKVTHDKLIDKIVYSWNGEEEVVLQGKGRKNIEETIDIPKGESNVIVLKVTDITGKTVTYSEQYEAKDLDKTAPVITIEKQTEGGKERVKIIVRDETELDHVEYFWNEEDPTTINAREESPKIIEEKIEALKGENTLYVIAYDKAGNKKTSEESIAGWKKPKIDITEDNNKWNIRITDEKEITKVIFEYNGQTYTMEGDALGDNRKDIQFMPLELRQGENKLKITVESETGLSNAKEVEKTVE